VDARDIEHLYRQLTTHPALSVNSHCIEQLALEHNTALLVAERNDTVVGTALLNICKDVMFGVQPFAVIENVVVDEPWHGQGVGHSLLIEAERIAKARQCSKIMLMSSVTRQGAHRFFEHAGYRGTVKRGFVKYSRDFAAQP
jgi:GNAT superfamily N-acetyltransferase